MEISAQAIELILNKKKILQSVDFKLADNEFVGIIGPNGSGKSTFLKCLYRVLQPNAGTVKFNGKYLDELSYRESAQLLAVVAQHNFYSFDFSVLEIVLMGRAPHKTIFEHDNAEDLAIARKALKTVGLENFSERNFSTLSGGEQQRVILARALTQQTDCLILDEPTNHLDIKYQLQVMDIVKSLNKSVVAAIHDLNIAAMYCDRLVALQEGKVIACGTPKEILTEDFLYKVYGVRSHILRTENERVDKMNIMYLPKHWQK